MIFVLSYRRISDENDKQYVKGKLKNGINVKEVQEWF
jgi:hypothetical protein